MNTKSQKEFESWLGTLPHHPHNSVVYDWCLATWKASRKQMLEGAIAICRTPIDEIQCTGSISELVYPDCDDIALELQELRE